MHHTHTALTPTELYRHTDSTAYRHTNCSSLSILGKTFLRRKRQRRRVSSHPPAAFTCQQGLTLVHFSAQRKRFLWDRGRIQGLFMGCLRDVMGYQGVLRVYFVPDTAQVEVRSGRE
jgi:hypothetical protein